MIITTLTCMCVDIFDNTIMPGGESLNFAATISRLTDAKVYKSALLEMTATVKPSLTA